MPLRLRLAALFAAASALAITAAGVVFLHQLRDNLDDTLDSGLRARLAATAQELATRGSPLTFGPGEELTQVQDLDGTVLAATPTAAGLALSPAQRERALDGTAVFTADVGGRRTRVLASTVPLGPSRVLVVLGADTDIADDAVARVRAALLVMGPIAVVLAGLAASVLAGAALRPVERMRREASVISAHDTERRLAVPTTRDEIAALGATINGLLDRLHHALERERCFVADAGHELRTPLAIVRAELELAARPGRSPAALRQAVTDAGRETERLITLTENLLLLARADNHQPILRVSPVRLDELLATATRRGRARDRRPAVELDCAELSLDADPDLLLQAVTNLLDNAVGHSPPGTPVRLCAVRDVDGGVLVEVIDAGPGLPPEFVPRAFERFQRAEQARSRATGGSGLGLSIVRAIADAHGGHARIANRLDGGACATVWLPPTTVVTDLGDAPAQRHAHRATP